MSFHLILNHGRRLALAGTTGFTGFATWKSHTDPVHLFWDLDHTILCSITPLSSGSTHRESSDNSQQSNPSNPITSSLLPSPPTLQHFDQIDDDFPYDPQTLSPNTRTYFRPGARLALQLCSYFGVLHVYTAAQETYTNNILKELDPDGTLFEKVIHRDDYPAIVKQGKDLTVGTDRMERALLFDDKLSNFRPQKYENGIGVLPYTSERVKKCGSWSSYLEEVAEMSRLVGISFLGLIHSSGDVRKVVGWFQDKNNNPSRN